MILQSKPSNLGHIIHNILQYSINTGLTDLAWAKKKTMVTRMYQLAGHRKLISEFKPSQCQGISINLMETKTTQLCFQALVLCRPDRTDSQSPMNNREEYVAVSILWRDEKNNCYWTVNCTVFIMWKSRVDFVVFLKYIHKDRDSFFCILQLSSLMSNLFHQIT